MSVEFVLHTQSTTDSAFGYAMVQKKKRKKKLKSIIDFLIYGKQIWIKFVNQKIFQPKAHTSHNMSVYKYTLMCRPHIIDNINLQNDECVHFRENYREKNLDKDTSVQ